MRDGLHRKPHRDPGWHFRTAGGNVTENAALKVMGTHIRSGRRDSIHRDIRSFVTETFCDQVCRPAERDFGLR
jgi:hypothetical protein